MTDNMNALLTYLKLPLMGQKIVTPTNLYLVNGSWLIAPESYGVKITNTNETRSIRDLRAYALLMNVIGDATHIVPYMEQVIETLIRRVANCTMNKFILIYDKDKVSVEVMCSLVKEMDVEGQESKMSSKQTWRIDTEAKTVHRYTPNQWMLESSTWNVEDYYNDIGGCLMLLNTINNRN